MGDGPFRFRLQRVLELREQHERAAASALTRAQDEADAARDAALRLVAAREALAATGQGGAAPVGALRMLGALLDHMDAHVADAGAAAEAADGAVAEREGALRAAYRDRRALDRLRERHHGAWRVGEAAADQQRMDEVARARRAANPGTIPGAPPGGPPADGTE